MYLPAHFAEVRSAVVHALVEQHPLATLVLSHADTLVANHVPLRFAANSPAGEVLQGHVARANPLWQMLAAEPRALAIFQGPQAYVSPSLYPGKAGHGKVVPTWNYAVVHVHGRLRAIDSREWLRALVTQQTVSQEQARAQPWQVSDAPAAYIDTMLGGIVGIELTVERIEGKYKLSQNRETADREGVIAGLSSSPGAAAATAALMVAMAGANRSD